MGKIRKDFKYKKIKNFFNKDELKILQTYCDIKLRVSTSNFFTTDWKQGFYGSYIVKQKRFFK